MIHRFSLCYDLDTTVAIAAGAYLDGEHYIFLHKGYTDRYEILRVNGRKIEIKQTWRFFGLRIGQTYTCEYSPPARFMNYGIKPYPVWMPSIHHLVKISTDLKYTPNEATGQTLSTLDVEMRLPFFLWPFRKYLERAVCRLKIEKDEEDILMIKRRAKLYGRENHSAYLADHQFLLHKDDYVAHFGRASPQPQPAASPASSIVH